MVYDKKCAVLVNSCDLYEEAWHPFFSLLRKYWKDCPFEIYLNTESKKYDEFEVKTINANGDSWSGRLHNALKEIKTPYVIILLEDFFFRSPVKTKEILDRIQFLEEDDNIACFYFNRCGYQFSRGNFENYYLMKPDKCSRYMFSLQAALWRKDVLETISADAVSPWEFEEYGYEKADQSIKNMEFYCSKDTFYDAVRDGDVFSYILVRDKGYGIWQSKWLWNNKKFFRREGIDFRYKNLKRMSWLEYKMSVLKKKIKNRLRRMWGKNNG